MIDKTYIENWARTVPAKAEFPELVLRLVQATIPPCQNKVDIPIGSSIFIRGWDGWINTKEGTTYIPQGVSGWEFGTDDSPITKANCDYKKRTLLRGFGQKKTSGQMRKRRKGNGKISLFTILTA